MIKFGQIASFTNEEFLLGCEGLLNERDYALVRSIFFHDGYDVFSSNDTYRQWLDFEKDFRNELVAFRAQKLNKDPLEYVRGDVTKDPFLEDIVLQAAKESNLCEAEDILDRTRWQFLDDISVGHYFDIDFIIIYALKLKILNRKNSFDPVIGEKVIESIVGVL